MRRIRQDEATGHPAIEQLAFQLVEARKAELQLRLDAPEMPELLHPRMADIYREKIGNLCRALETHESRTGAVDAIRALSETILLEPRW